MIPSHVAKQIKLILGAGSEAGVDIPLALETLVGAYIAAMRYVSHEDVTGKELAMMMTLLASTSDPGPYGYGDVLFHSDRNEDVKFYRDGFSGYSIVDSPSSGLIWVREVDLSRPGPVSSTEEKRVKGRKQAEPAPV